tara:strand:+ start:715 stop:1581 length:867 start_codon:yes stop_codon:yes gene_type:complete
MNFLSAKLPFSQIPDKNQMLAYATYIYILFARLFYCLFDSDYKLTFYNFVRINNGGLSSFGGQFFVILFLYLFSYTHSIKFGYILDVIVLLIPNTAIFIRSGNYVNKEMKGRVIENVSIIELFLHGIVFGCIVWHNYLNNYVPGTLINIYTKYYGTIRFFTEFIREKKKYYNLEYEIISIGIWQVFSLITINPFFSLLIIDQYFKQYFSVEKYNVNVYQIRMYTFLFFIFWYIDCQINIILLCGLLSNMIDICIYNRIRNGAGTIYILSGLLIQMCTDRFNNIYYEYM